MKTAQNIFILLVVVSVDKRGARHILKEGGGGNIY